jgi:hypothetical protein
MVSKSTIFESQPLIQFSERHGGPKWYKLSIITFEFFENQELKITIDPSLTKDMVRYDLSPKIILATYRMFGDPYGKSALIQCYDYGKITMADGQIFEFEKIPADKNYLFVESPTFWKESFVLKLKTK